MLVDRYGELSDDDVKQLLPGSLSFLEDGCRVLWKALTGERVSRPKDPPVWPSYEQHVHYRNAIAHGSAVFGHLRLLQRCAVMQAKELARLGIDQVHEPDESGRVTRVRPAWTGC